MKIVTKSRLIALIKAIAYGIIGAVVMFLVAGIHLLNSKSDLKIWHTAELDAEFTAASPVNNFEDYLALEKRLFAQLNDEVYAHIAPEDKLQVNRYNRDSLSDPKRWSPNWNRSYVLAPDSSAGPPAAGVLLIHGLSDSPYSLHSIAEKLHGSGAYVLGLRVPGHGTAPSALTRTTWQDMAAAVELAMRHLQEKTGDRPLHIVGYSNGGALAVHYALTSLEDSSLPSIERIVLLSPEIGISRMAAFAIWQERIGRWLGLKKLAWTDVIPEYDPFKYCSFPVNAGNLAYRLTGVNRSKIERAAAAGKLGSFPELLAFQSAIDSTVSAPALVRDLFARLPEGGHELVVFDINRITEIEALLVRDPKSEAAAIIDDPKRAFTFSVVTNANPASENAVVRSWPPGQSTYAQSDIGLSWSKDLYSLAHVALPFRGDDPVYGGDQPGKSPGIHLGDLSWRGEKGALQIPARDMLRLRWNPFYPYLEERTTEWLKLDEP